MKNKVKRRVRLALLAACCFLLAHALIISPIVTVSIYESIFHKRHQTPPELRFSVEEYAGLRMERSDFPSAGATLAGYCYAKDTERFKGVLIIAHGLGNGQNAYMPLVNEFASNGYAVFAYDARGSDNSEGDAVRGLPQGVIDLDNAICHAKSLEEYRDLPIVLLGHSWGGYAVGSVLALHPDVKAAVIVAGFNESEDMLLHRSEQVVGAIARVTMPYLKLYEWIKFGRRYADLSAVQGMGQTEAGILILHSSDDATVPVGYGYDTFYAQFGGDDRFRFILYEDRGHNDLLYAKEALAYRAEHADKERCYTPNPELVEQALALFDAYCGVDQ